MLRLVELEDGTFRLTIDIENEPVEYHEVSTFEKVENRPEVSEKEHGYKFVI